MAGQLPELNHPFWKIYKGSVMYVNGKKYWMYPKIWRWQVVRLLHCKLGGETDGAKNILLMTRMEEKLTPIKLNNWAFQTVSGYLEARVGENQVNIGSYSTIRDRV